MLSGAAQKALAQYGQGFASNEYNNAYNRYNTDQTNAYNKITGATQIGQNATNTLVGANTDYANQVGNLVTGAGNAQAAGTVGSANALVSGLNSVGNAGTAYGAQQNQNNQNALNRTAYSGGNLNTYNQFANTPYNNSSNYG